MNSNLLLHFLLLLEKSTNGGFSAYGDTNKDINC